MVNNWDLCQLPPTSQKYYFRKKNKIPKPVRFCPTWKSTTNVTTKKNLLASQKNYLGQETDIKKNNGT